MKFSEIFQLETLFSERLYKVMFEILLKIQHWVNQINILSQRSEWTKCDMAIYQQSFRISQESADSMIWTRAFYEAYMVERDEWSDHSY